MLVERLVARGALRQGGLVARVLLIDAARVVVLHLVVIPCDDPWERGMRRLKILVGLVLRVAIAVVGEAEAPAPLAVVTDDVPTRRPLVDVVAEKKDGVEILARQVRVRRVVALHVVLAGGEGETERLRGSARGRGGAGAADGTLDAGGTEAVPVDAVRFERAHLDVHGVRELGERAGSARAHHVLHGIVARHCPLDIHGRAPHPSARERVGRETRPQNDAVGCRVARGDTERERVLVELEGLRLYASRDLTERGKRREPCGCSEERTAIHRVALGRGDHYCAHTSHTVSDDSGAWALGGARSPRRGRVLKLSRVAPGYSGKSRER